MTKYNIQTIIVSGTVVVVTVFLGAAFFAWTLVPHLQMTRYVHAITSNGKLSLPTLQDRVFMSYTYVQPELRNDFLGRMLDALEEGRTNQQVVMTAINQLEEVVVHQPNYSRYPYTLTRAYTLLAKQDSDHKSDYLAKVTRYFEQVHALVPNSQETNYLYSNLLISQGKYDEAVQVMRRVIAMGPEVADNHEYLARSLVSTGSTGYSEALQEYERFFESKSEIESRSITVARPVYLKFLTYFQQKNDREKFFTVLNRLQIIDPKNAKKYRQVEDFVHTNRRLPNIGLQ